jgi:hypothetical protein
VDSLNWSADSKYLLLHVSQPTITGVENAAAMIYSVPDLQLVKTVPVRDSTF